MMETVYPNQSRSLKSPSVNLSSLTALGARYIEHSYPLKGSQASRIELSRSFLYSIIIPAHNEANVISECLRSIASGGRGLGIEIIVVANGCSDGTGCIVAKEFPYVRLIEIDVASKVAALNAGDEIASFFPRIYVDADVVFPFQDLQRIAKRLEAGDVLAVAPRPRIITTGCSQAVKAFYRVHALLPAGKEGLGGGSGVFAVSEAGHARFGVFPNVTADDTFVRLHFAPSERATVPSAHSMVFAPKSLRNLIAIQTRFRVGNGELQRRFPDLWSKNQQKSKGHFLRLMWKPNLWFGIFIYLLVKVVARMRAWRSVGSSKWERDSSSRENRSYTEVPE